MADSPFRVGAIGCGARGRSLLRHAARADDVEITALYDPSPQAALQAQREHAPDAAVVDGIDQVVSRDDVDLVIVGSPDHAHREPAVAAFEHGKHVFCEKPLATSPEAAQRMVDAAARHGVLLMEAMVFRYHPQTLRLRRLLDAGAIGDLRHVAMHMGGPLPSGNIRWQPDLGGGALADIGCYLIDVARWAAGTEPVRVSAAWRETRQGGVDSRIGLLLEFPDAVVATLFGTFDAMPVRGAQLAGSGGSLHIEQPTHPYEESAYTLTTPQATERATLNNGVRAFTPSLDHFHDCLLDGAAPMLPNSDAIATARVMGAAAESARTGRTVHLDRIRD